MYSHSCLYSMRDFWTDMSMAGYLQKSILKDADKSDTAALAVMWRILVLLLVPNWFHCTDVSK